MKTKNLFIVLSLLVLAGCKTIGPAAFWNDFDERHMVKKTRDQGPWGGYCLMYWKNNDKPYNAKDLVVFASLNKWQHFKTDSLQKNEMIGWIQDRADSLSIHHPSNYPQVTAPGVSFTFADSNWISIDSDESKPALGYVFLSSDGRQMVVYHSWGD
jgi:hypothetical protein